MPVGSGTPPRTHAQPPDAQPPHAQLPDARLPDAQLPDAQPDARCPRCGATFVCGASTGHCWCASLPALASLPDDLPPECLCPSCLREATRIGKTR